GDVILGGSFQGSDDFGHGTIRALGGPDGIVGKYSGADGSFKWTAQIGGAGAVTSVNSVAVDRAGDVYATGSFTSTVNVSGASLSSAGANDAFLVKYSGANGGRIWSLQVGGTSQDKGYAVAVDTNGDVFITGFFAGTANFGGTVLTSVGASDIFLAKYAGADGHPLWAKSMGGTGSDSGTGLAPGVSGAIAITGKFSNSVDFGGGPLGSVGGSDIFVAMYSGSGQHLWSRAGGGTGDDVASGIATDQGGNPVITGYFYYSANLGGAALPGSTVPT